MSILSLEFLVLAAAVILVYYLLPLKIRWIALLCGSAAFIAFAGRYSAAHLSAVALILWGGGLLLRWKKSKLILALLLILDLGAMAFLKYYPALSGAELLLPLGLSYFTFQSAGYLIDVYRRKAEAQKNPLKAALPKYMLPDVILKRDSLPRTGSGKLDRIALKQEAEREHLIP